jgi:hypothetical protein
VGRDGRTDCPGHTVQFVEKHLGGQFRLLIRPLPHGGQAHCLGEIVIVDSHHRQVLRDTDPGPCGFEDNTHGHFIRGAEDGGRPGTGTGPEPPERFLAAAEGKVSPLVPFGAGGKSRSSHDVLERLDPHAGNVEVQVGFGVAVQERNVPVAEIDQVPDGGGGSGVVVDADVSALFHVATHHHQRDIDLL